MDRTSRARAGLEMTSEVPRAIAAATSTASALGLTVDDAIVLHDSNKLALRLLPCDVLARVAPVAHQVAQFEVDLAQRLSETESPVAALEPRVEPRVYEHDGFVVTLWTYYEPLSPPEVLTGRLRRRARAAACRHAEDRYHDAALHGSCRGGATARCEPRPHSGARRRGPGASQPHVAKPETSEQRPRRTTSNCCTASRIRATCSARRTGHCSSTSKPVVVGRSNSTSPMCPKRSASAIRALIENCSASAGASSLRWSPRGAGIGATDSRTGNELRENSSTPYARVHRTRRSTP